MKFFLVVGLLCFVYTFSCQAQNVYSRQNLEQASQKELNLYLGKAWKLEKVGNKVFLAGAAGTATGLILAYSGYKNDIDGMLYLGAGIFYVGFGTTVVGLTILITNSSRVKRISKVMANRSEGVFIEMVPCRFHNYLAQNYQNGVSLRIRF